MHKKILEAVRGCVLGKGESGLQQLSQLSKHDEFLPELLNVAVNQNDGVSSTKEDVMLQAAIQFKNFLRERKEPIPFEPLIMGVFQAPSTVAKVLLAAIKDNAKKDMRDQSFVSIVKNSFEEGSPEIGLAILRKVSAIYKNAESEAPMERMMQSVFPTIQQIMFSGIDTFCKEAEQSFKSVFKIFANATFGSVGWYLRARNGEAYKNWLQFHHKFLRAQPQSQAAVDATRSLCQQIQKYGNVRFCPADVLCFQSALVNQKWVVTLSINMWNSPNPKVLVPAIKAATALLANQQTRDRLLGEFEPIRFVADFELLQLTKEDSQIWDSDPQQFLRRDASDSDFESPRSAILQFLILYTRPTTVEGEDWKGGKKKVMKVNSDILEAYIQKCINILQSDQADQVQVELALYLLGNLFEHALFLDPEDYASLAVNASVQCLELLECKKSLLIFRAAWLLGRFATALNDQSHSAVAKALSNLIVSDNELLIKAQASASIALFFSHGLGKDIKLEPLLNVLLKLIKEVDMDGLFEALEMLLFHARNRIEPFAIDLLNELLPRFKQLASESNCRSELAGSVLDSIKVLLRGCKQAPHIFVKIESELLTVIATMLSPAGSMYAEDGLQLFSLILHYTPSLQQHHWDALPVLQSMVCEKTPGGHVQQGWGFDLFPQMLYAFQNYVARDSDALGSGVTPPLDIIMELCGQVMELCFLKEDYDIECLVVSKIYITLIENTSSDFPLPHQDLTNIAMEALRLIKAKEEAEQEMEKIENDKKKLWATKEDIKQQNEVGDEDEEEEYDRLKSVNLQIICLLCARDIKGTFKYLGSEEKLGFMLSQIYDFLPKFKHHFELRRVLIGIAHILGVEEEMLPDKYAQSMVDLFQRSVPAVLLAVKHQVDEARPELRKFILKEEEDLANPQAEEDKNVVGELYRKSSKNTKNWRTIDVSDSDDSSDDEDGPTRSSVFFEKGVRAQVKMDLRRIAKDLGEQELADDDILEDYSVLYSSPIDTANEVAIFENTMSQLSQARSDAYLSGMSMKQVNELKEAFETSKQIFSSK